MTILQPADETRHQPVLLLVRLHRRGGRGELFADSRPVDLLLLQQRAGLRFEFLEEKLVSRSYRSTISCVRESA